jgi:hypothetical protein
MGRATSTLVLSPWVGGLNTAEDPIVLGLTPEGQQQLSEAENIIYKNKTGQKKRGGQARFNATAMNDGTSAAVAVDGIYATTFWYNGTATTKSEDLVVVAESGRMYHAPAYGSLTALTFSAVTPTFSQGVITSEVMNEKLFIGYSKTQSALVYSGNSAAVSAASASSAVIGTFPPGYIFRQHVNRLFSAGNAASPDRLSYSNTELPFAYGTAGGFIDILPGDGDPEGITAIFPPVNSNELYVAKRSSIFKIDTSSLDPNEWSVIPVSRGIGCVQHNSAQAVDQGDVIFASDRGIHSLQQVISQTAVITGKFISAPIQPDFDAASNKKLISAIWAPDLNSYLFNIQRAGQSFCENVYGYNVQRGAWYQWTSVPANFLFKRLNTTTQTFEYYAAGDSSSSNNRGFINKLQQTNLWDFSSATGNIVTLISTGLLYAEGNYLQERNFVNIILLARSRDNSPIQVSYSIDEVTNGAGMIQQRIIGSNVLGSSSYLLGTTFVLGAPSGAKPLFLHTNGVGNAIKVKIRHDTIGKDLELFGLAVELDPAEESQNAFRAFPNQ